MKQAGNYAQSFHNHNDEYNTKHNALMPGTTNEHLSNVKFKLNVCWRSQVFITLACRNIIERIIKIWSIAAQCTMIANYAHDDASNHERQPIVFHDSN
jgi:hypothetical protein